MVCKHAFYAIQLDVKTCLQTSKQHLEVLQFFGIS